ncbi:hypothetical protein LZ31DRAFT_392224 [Colletotrichum somersetense]|nr:hypothetical protein LZ31DRAFT_392224 [Colletotrichum somersetense]
MSQAESRPRSLVGTQHLEINKKKTRRTRLRVVVCILCGAAFHVKYTMALYNGIVMRFHKLHTMHRMQSNENRAKSHV